MDTKERVIGIVVMCASVAAIRMAFLLWHYLSPPAATHYTTVLAPSRVSHGKVVAESIPLHQTGEAAHQGPSDTPPPQSGGADLVRGGGDRTVHWYLFLALLSVWAITTAAWWWWWWYKVASSPRTTSIVQPPTADVTPVRPAMSPAAAAASPARARSVHEDKALEGLQQLEAQASQQVMRLEFLLESLSESVAPIVVHPTPAV